MKKILKLAFIAFWVTGYAYADENVVIKSDDMSKVGQKITDVNKVALSNAQNVHYITNLNVAQVLEKTFPEFYKYLKKAGLAAAIEEAKDITIFAPTDEAFNQLRDDILGVDAFDNIFNDAHGIKKLRKILKMHIFPERMLSTELRHMEEVTPYEGRKLPLHQGDAGGISIDDTAHIVDVDIIGTNGVIHALDAVIM